MSDELKTYRKLTIYAGLIYFGWWFAVHFSFPEAFNPFGSRLAVAIVILAIPALSYFNELTRRNLRLLFMASTWLITAHYFYLFHGNNGDINWILGTFITVIAINMALPTSASLVWYSVFVLVLSAEISFVIPSLQHSVFLPGMITIVAQANFALHARLKALKNLEESNKRFRLLFNSSFEGVFVHDNRKIIAANEALADISGYPVRELIGLDAMNLIAVGERALVQKNISSDSGIPYETLAVRKDGTTVEIEIRGKNFDYDHRPTRLVTVQTITDRKKAERERVVALALAENVRQRDEFISIASHELKTPLSSLKMQTQIIERQLEKDPAALTPAKLKDFSALVSRQAERLNRLVEAMLDVSLISSARIELKIERFDLALVTRELVELARAQSGKSTSSIDLEAPADFFIEGDKHRLEQVIDNLLSNAFKYGSGKPIHVRLRELDGIAILDFEDRGIGIPEEHRQRIFGRFERAISAHSISGLGLGLYISQQIVEAHGGKIEVHSELGVRSVFTVRLPLRRS